MAIPAIKQYRKKNPDHYICFATLNNRGSATTEILEPFVDEVAPILTEPWKFVEDGTGDLYHGRRIACGEADGYVKNHGFDYGIEITMSPTIHHHKVIRVALEMGAFPLDNIKPELPVSFENFKFGKHFISDFDKEKPIMFFHGTAGNKRKSLSQITANVIIDDYVDNGNSIVIECGSNYSDKTVKYNPKFINDTIGILSCVDKVICIDSIVMHLAYAIDKSMVVYFSITPPEQVFGRGFQSNKKVEVRYL